METVRISVENNTAEILDTPGYRAKLPTSDVISFDAYGLVLKTPTWYYVLPPGVKVPVPLSYRVYTVESVHYSREKPEKTISTSGDLIATFPVSVRKQQGKIADKVEKHFTRGPFIAEDHWNKAHKTPTFMQNVRTDSDLDRF